ncbi:hypothetical protein ACGFMM_07630 [Streptomyces sp. NPDC048604]|uniref:hypothetical protein n=1 Tax=Streptomyces sp. NPDC048604 TaxID=3365578 RepID=UPI003723512B
MRRLVYLLCFGPGHEVLTLRQEPAGRLTLPSTRRRERETYEQAALRLMATGDIRPGDVVARAEPLSMPSPTGRREVRIFTAHADEPFPMEAGGWEQWEAVLPELRHLGIPAFALLIEGYIGGWIPDGWVTLDPD